MMGWLYAPNEDYPVAEAWRKPTPPQPLPDIRVIESSRAYAAHLAGLADEYERPRLNPAARMWQDTDTLPVIEPDPPAVRLFNWLWLPLVLLLAGNAIALMLVSILPHH